MRVFRVQRRSDGQGPYGSASPLSRFIEIWNSNSRHPDPWSDSSLLEWAVQSSQQRAAYFFCFPSKEGALHWFYSEEWREALHSGGFELSEWEVSPDDVIMGQQQGVFLIARATQVDSHPIPFDVEGLSVDTAPALS